MSYTNEMDFGVWVSQVGFVGRSAIEIINEAKILYDKWYDMTYGLTNAQIIALPQFVGKTEADISRMAYAVGVFNALYEAKEAGKGYLIPIL